MTDVVAQMFREDRPYQTSDVTAQAFREAAMQVHHRLHQPEEVAALLLAAAEQREQLDHAKAVSAEAEDYASQVTDTQRWRPITTAPRDGTRMLFWSSGTGYWPIIGRWCEDRFHTMGYFGYDSPMLGEPSHWQPLPKGPNHA